MDNKIGRIEIIRQCGIEIWNLKSGQFSIDKPTDRFRLNFWVQSDTDYIKKLEDTGGNPISFEITFPILIKPDFYELWKYKYPEKSKQENEFFDNFYYYEHDSLLDMAVQIIRHDLDIYTIEVRGTRMDPIDPNKYGDAQYKITANLPMKTKFEGKWDE